MSAAEVELSVTVVGSCFGGSKGRNDIGGARISGKRLMCKARPKRAEKLESLSTVNVQIVLEDGGITRSQEKIVLCEVKTKAAN